MNLGQHCFFPVMFRQWSLGWSDWNLGSSLITKDIDCFCVGTCIYLWFKYGRSIMYPKFDPTDLNPWPPDHQRYISCLWDTYLSHWAIRDLFKSAQIVSLLYGLFVGWRDVLLKEKFFWYLFPWSAVETTVLFIEWNAQSTWTHTVLPRTYALVLLAGTAPLDPADESDCHTRDGEAVWINERNLYSARWLKTQTHQRYDKHSFFLHV